MQWHPSVWVKGREIEIHFHYFSRIRTEQHGYCKLALPEFIRHGFGECLVYYEICLLTHESVIFNYIATPAANICLPRVFIHNLFVCQFVFFVIKSHKLATVIYVALVRITIYLESGGLFINDCSFK